MTSSKAPTSKDRVESEQGFNRFKGSTLIVIGLILLINSVLTPLGTTCACPPEIVGETYHPPIAVIIVPAMFFSFVGTTGVSLIVFGPHIFKRGTIPWRRFSPGNIGLALAVFFIGMIVTGLVFWILS